MVKVKVFSWNTVSKDEWMYQTSEKECTYIAYQLEQLPDFTAHRFEYLCKENDDRVMEIAKKQMQMLRQLHNLGNDWTISMRILKKNMRLSLYIIFRYAGQEKLSNQQMSVMKERISNSLMKNEYSFEEASEDSLKEALNVDWASQAAEVFKKEEKYQSDMYPDGSQQSFYVPYSWLSADNNMEQICRTLVQYSGQAVIEVFVQPTQYDENERDWMNISLTQMKECMNGETIRGTNGKILWQGQKLPIFKTPVDNLEKMNKQYEISRLFMTSIRVFSDGDVRIIAEALLANSVKSEGMIQVFRKGFAQFEYVAECYENVELSAEIHTAYCNRNRDVFPMRAQRLCRLCSVEEIANFFRIPIPVKAGFPGFGLDTGLEQFTNKKKARSIIRLGSYLDEAGSKNIPAEFDSQQLAKHGLIVGVPGSGKTTAMFNILYQFWAVPDEQKIPFIILEPAKTEYRALKLLPEFKDDLLVFSLGDESVSPFRFNPMEVLPGIKIESHISKLQSCFVGAFDLFDPLPIFLEQAIRRTYLEKGWYEDSRGGEEGLETPTLSDLCRNAEYIVSHSGFDAKMKSDFQASLLERLNSLRRGSKGRMLDTKKSIPMEELMGKPVVLELDSLNGDEKSLLMMFLLSYVYEYCKVKRKSGSPLKHMLLVEEAHNLISSQGGESDNRADPKSQTIELFVNMLAEMRALGQGILIADQLPTAIAPQAVKQTNVKVLMRVTAKDDREEIGNTMDLNEEQMHQVVNFKTGHAYLYHEGEDRVRMIRMLNFKGEHDVEEPPSDDELKQIMAYYEESHKNLFIPYEECEGNCDKCNRRVRNQAENFVQHLLLDHGADPYQKVFAQADESQLEGFKKTLGLCSVCMLNTKKEYERILKRYKTVGDCFGYCVYVHMLNMAEKQMEKCHGRFKKCSCTKEKYSEYLKKFMNIGREE